MSNIEMSMETEHLKQYVNFVKHGLGNSKTDLPVMLIRMDLKGSTLTLFTANKEMFCRSEFKVNRPDEGAKDGSFCVMGGKLVDLINAAESERVNIKADVENLEITAGFLVVNLVLYDGASLKQVENSVADHLTMEGEPMERAFFEEALCCARSCTTLNSIRPDVTHVELRKKRMLSSDGRKIMIYSHDKFDEKINFKCSATALNSVIMAVKTMTPETVSISEGASYYFVRGGLNNFSFGIRKIERVFPAVEGQIESAPAPTDEISVDKNIFEAILRGVSIGIDSDEVKIQVEASGEGTDAYLEVSAKNSLDRRSYERTSAGRTGKKPVVFPVSYKHLLDTLAVFKGDSVVDMLVMDKQNLLMVMDVTPHREVTTIIPFRTDEQIEREKREAAEAEALKKKAQEGEALSDDPEENADIAASAVESEAEDIDLEG